MAQYCTLAGPRKHLSTDHYRLASEPPFQWPLLHASWLVIDYKSVLVILCTSYFGVCVMCVNAPINHKCHARIQKVLSEGVQLCQYFFLRERGSKYR